MLTRCFLLYEDSSNNYDGGIIDHGDVCDDGIDDNDDCNTFLSLKHYSIFID